MDVTVCGLVAKVLGETVQTEKFFVAIKRRPFLPVNSKTNVAARKITLS